MSNKQSHFLKLGKMAASLAKNQFNFTWLRVKSTNNRWQMSVCQIHFESPLSVLQILQVLECTWKQ